MNDILKSAGKTGRHTNKTIEIISNLQNTIKKLNQDDDNADIEFSQFEEDANYIKKLAQKVTEHLTPPVPHSSSISLAKKFNKIKTNSKVIVSTPKFIKAKPKIMMTEKSQQTCDDKKTSKAHQDGVKNKKHKSRKQENDEVHSKALSNFEFHDDAPLQPTKYLQHILIPVNPKNLSSQSVPTDWQYDGRKLFLNESQKITFKQGAKQRSGVEHFTKLMQLCMNVKEERESDLEKQIYNLEAEIQAVMESNKYLHTALARLEKQNAVKKILKDTSTNTLSDKILIKVDDTQREKITSELAEDIINSIHADIQEITANIAITNSKSRLIFREHDKTDKQKYAFGKHVSYLERAIASMQNKLETAQNKQFELAIQSKAVVEAAHRMTNKPWTY